MQVVRSDKSVKFKSLEMGAMFLAHGTVPYIKLNHPVNLTDDSRDYTAVHLGTGACLSAIGPEVDCIPIKGKFVEDAK